jgi:hypothetical protein
MDEHARHEGLAPELERRGLLSHSTEEQIEELINIKLFKARTFIQRGCGVSVEEGNPRGSRKSHLTGHVQLGRIPLLTAL